jgi:hypothetical protein
MKKNLNNDLQVIKDDLARRTAAANKLGENAKAEADAVIARLNEAVAAIETAVEENGKGEEDKSSELQAKMDEVLAELADLRKKTETVPVETANRRKKITNSVQYAYDFLQTVKNSANASEFRANVNELAVKNAITPDDSFLPDSMVKAITDGFSGKHRLLELVDWTGLPMFRALYETGNAVGAVHTKGAKKTDQALTFSPIDIRPDIIYKYLAVDKVMLKQCETPEQANVLLEYITKELLDRVLFTVEQGILNGTEPFNKPKRVSTSDTGILDRVKFGLSEMDNFTDPVLICTKEAYFNMLLVLETEFYSGSVFGDDYLAKALRVREIIPVNVKPEPSNSLGMWLMQPEDYKLVGDLRPDQYNSFNLEYNKEQYLTEIYIGGGSINPNNFIELTTTE